MPKGSSLDVASSLGFLRLSTKAANPTKRFVMLGVINLGSIGNHSLPEGL